MAATRVYILAKELGVKSTAIVKKCQDEGLDVKNHMSSISAGLAATICEWFSEGENVTTVEQSEKVDLKKVRIKKKPKRAQKKAVKKEKKQEQTEKGVSEGDSAVEVLEPTTEQLPIIEAEQIPPEPEPIVPAGPMLKKPKPAKLSGPKIVRIEKPDLPSPPKPKRKARYDEPVTEPLMYSDKKTVKPGIEETKKDDKKGPKRHKERTHGRRKDEREAEAAKKFKFSNWRQRDIEERQARLEAAGGEGLRSRPVRKIATRSSMPATVSGKPQKVTISEPVTIKDLSSVLAVRSTDIIRKLMQQGHMVTANQTITADMAELIALEFAVELTVERKETLEQQMRAEFENRERTNLQKRPVVATMLGHVDHGKTSLLDRIRSTQVTAGEAGGITQHIGAYQVAIGDKKVTFLDTPGHEAFTAMRARGANITDVAVLIVAADDGVMPQTIEAIHHAKAANVSIIVALNKIDLPGVDLNRIYAQLSEHELTPVEWGGDTEVVKTSAITGAGIDDLIEHLDYVAELLDLKADNTIPAAGWVVEARMSPKRGSVATVLIKEGRLSKGDVILAGGTFGRVKVLKDSFGKSIRTATSSMPVEITGLNDVPQAGDRFYCLKDINKAKAAAEQSRMLSRQSALAERTQVTLDNLFSQIEAGRTEELNIIVRADVQGSVDVLKKYLSELSNEEVKIRILHASTGGITEGDVVLAEASNAIIIGFNVVSEEQAARIAEEKGVDIRFYNIIYRITEDLKKSMVGMLEPEEQENFLGRAAIRTTFKVSRIGTIAGCYVSDGLVNKNAKVRLVRSSVIIKNDLKIESLKHFKDDVREVKSGLECGIKLAKYDDVKIDDVLEFYEIVKIARTLESVKSKSEN